MGNARVLAARSRRVLPWLVGWMAFQGLLAIAGRLAARRLDEGDENSASIRRVLTLSGAELHPASPTLSRIELDMAMAGAELDLTDTPPLPGGVDVRVRMVMGGLVIRVPRDWKVWWEFSGVGGIGADDGVERTPEWVGADLRLNARVLLGGVGIESAGG
jgi:hypothetical protein